MNSTSRALFLGAGAFWLLIGVLTPLVMDRWTGPSALFVTHSSDQALFGAPPEEILAGSSQLTTFRGMVMRALAGLLVAAGLAVAGLAWFGLREPRAWMLGVLTAVGLVVLPYWWITLTPYRAAGIRLSIGQIPPFMWVPAILMSVGATLGWIGLSRG